MELCFPFSVVSVSASLLSLNPFIMCSEHKWTRQTSPWRNSWDVWKVCQKHLFTFTHRLCWRLLRLWPQWKCGLFIFFLSGSRIKFSILHALLFCSSAPLSICWGNPGLPASPPLPPVTLQSAEPQVYLEHRWTKCNPSCGRLLTTSSLQRSQLCALLGSPNSQSIQSLCSSHLSLWVLHHPNQWASRCPSLRVHGSLSEWAQTQSYLLGHQRDTI